MNDNPLSTLLVITAIGLAIWYFLKKQEIPITQLAYPQGSGTAAPALNAEMLADQLHDSMDGLGILHPGGLKAKEAAFTDLLHQNDTTIIQVNEIFNKKYGKKGTLRTWVSGEVMGIWGYGDVKTALLRRLQALGCK